MGHKNLVLLLLCPAPFLWLSQYYNSCQISREQRLPGGSFIFHVGPKRANPTFCMRKTMLNMQILSGEAEQHISQYGGTD